MHPTEKIDSGSKSLYEHFVRMKGEFETIAKKSMYTWQERHELVSICGKKNEIVSIADVTPNLERVLRKLIELVHVNIHEKLRRKVSERQTLSLFNTRCCTKAGDDVLEENESTIIRNPRMENVKKDSVVDRSKELSDIAF